MIKEQIEERLKTLTLERIQVLSNYDGAIQDCNYWLQQFEAPSTEEAPKE